MGVTTMSMLYKMAVIYALNMTFPKCKGEKSVNIQQPKRQQPYTLCSATEFLKILVGGKPLPSIEFKPTQAYRK